MLQLKASQNDGASENLKNEFVVLFFLSALKLLSYFLYLIIIKQVIHSFPLLRITMSSSF